MVLSIREVHEDSVHEFQKYKQIQDQNHCMRYMYEQKDEPQAVVVEALLQSPTAELLKNRLMPLVPLMETAQL